MAKPEKSTKKTNVVRGKVARATKLERKLNGTSAKTPFSLKTGLFTVTAFAQSPVEIPGYLVERNDTHTVFRHKATSASKKMVVSVFDNSKVLEQLGKVGEVGSVTVLQRKAFVTVIGTIKFDGGFVVVTTEDGEVSRFNTGPDVEIKGLDLEGSQASGRGAPAKTVKGDKKSSKVTSIKEGKKKVKK